jgi:hypothetical protein
MEMVSIDVGTMRDIDLLVTQVGPELFRVEEEAALYFGAADGEDPESYPRYGDVIQVEPTGEDSYRYVRVHERTHRHYMFFLFRELISAKSFADFLEQLGESGGYWERHMEGVLYVSIPKSASFDVEAELGRAMEAVDDVRGPLH